MPETDFRPIHPFPARMAPEVVFDALRRHQARRLRVLDPMAGSGTTIVTARLAGHEAFGVDRDPLAVMIAKGSSADLDADLFLHEAEQLLRTSRLAAGGLKGSEWYPVDADDETREFVRYWFDARSRKQLAAIVRVLNDKCFKTERYLKLVVSRMIITKQSGVSLAADVSHSRPHKVHHVTSPVKPFDVLMRHARFVVNRAVFIRRSGYPRAHVRFADCRSLPYEDDSFDIVVTSPPYLNAIDYLRGHKLSLVWLGYSIPEIRALRSTNVGSDRGLNQHGWDDVVTEIVGESADLKPALRNRVRRYASDLDKMVGDIVRVTRPGGQIHLVVGDCTIRGHKILNSEGLRYLAARYGLFEANQPRRRDLLTGRRYLPPPEKITPEGQITNRMWDEVILEYNKQ